MHSAVTVTVRVDHFGRVWPVAVQWVRVEFPALGGAGSAGHSELVILN